MSLGIILIHGYTGSKDDFTPLADKLGTNFGKDSINNISLPGHDSHQVPEFDENLFIETIHHAINRYKKENRKIIIIGHSTGGNLALSTLRQFSIKPDLLILIAVPKKIDLGYLERWNSHRVGKENISLVDISMLVKFINSTGSKRLKTEFPVLVIHGENDRLVPSIESQTWRLENFLNSARVVTIPQADHDIFKSTNSHLVTDIIKRAIVDLSMVDDRDKKTINSLIQVEPEFKDFFENFPFSESHLALCPSSQRVMGKKPELSPTSKNDPVIANIEITTYCNLKCQFCARSQLKKSNKHMSFDSFCNILAVLPNIYKIVLVGLGETLMHPQIVDFIKHAKTLKKKVGLVTNAMLLNRGVSEQLLDAGLDSIAFSIDGFDEKLSSLVRKGTDFNKVIKNIKEFVEISNSTRKISKAVFSAVSTETVSNLKDLIERVTELGVDVLMLSDINFKANLDHTLWKNINEELEETVKKAISYAFSKNLPVLSVHGLEEFGLEKRYQDFLMIPPGQLYQRSTNHTWCFSPWQTIPIDVDGNITLCDCQPDFVIGNLFQDSFSNIWNGEALKKYRTEMLSQNPPEACKICPRF
jgi:radical SAM protein with 4Fe4S-binding SPASM domain